ncbi:MAG: hypothetical protein KDC44_22050, partial [Phaeodactylibacter sp.]|nr:hypothetical protein [Phaeodactylibacter sp.]
LQQAADTLKSATGNASVLSHRAFLHQQKNQSGSFQLLVDQLYQFLKSQELPSGRITHSDIDAGTTLFLNAVLPLYQLHSGELSTTELDSMKAIHPKIALLAAQLKRHAQSSPQQLTTADSNYLFEEIQDLEDALYFDFLGSEAGQPVTAIKFDTTVEVPLTEAQIQQALNLDPTKPQDKIERYLDAQDFFPTFLDFHAEMERGETAQAFINLMQQTFDPKLLVIGADYHPEVDPKHTVYILGIASDGNLVGIRSAVIWT